MLAGGQEQLGVRDLVPLLLICRCEEMTAYTTMLHSDGPYQLIPSWLDTGDISRNKFLCREEFVQVLEIADHQSRLQHDGSCSSALLTSWRAGLQP